MVDDSRNGTRETRDCLHAAQSAITDFAADDLGPCVSPQADQLTEEMFIIAPCGFYSLFRVISCYNRTAAAEEDGKPV